MTSDGYRQYSLTHEAFYLLIGQQVRDELYHLNDSRTCRIIVPHVVKTIIIVTGYLMSDISSPNNAVTCMSVNVPAVVITVLVCSGSGRLLRRY